MKDKVRKIREEVVRIQLYTQSEVLKQVLDYIDEVQKEPLSEDLEKASKEWLAPQLDKSYANYGEAKMMELTHFDGYAMLDAIEFGSQWQKEQMMKDAVNGLVYAQRTNGEVMFRSNYVRKEGFEFGDKVKVIVIKED